MDTKQDESFMMVQRLLPRIKPLEQNEVSNRFVNVLWTNLN